MDLSTFSLQPEKLLYLAHTMYKDNLIDNKQKEQAKELIVNDDQQLYSWLNNYENSHKNLQFLQDQFIYLINLNLQEKQNQSEEKKNGKRVKIIDHNDSQDPCLSRNSNSSSPMSRAGWKRPSFAISKQRMGAKVTKMFTEENMSDLNTTKESSPEKNHKVSLTANHTPKSGLQRNQIVIPQLFIDEEVFITQITKMHPQKSNKYFIQLLSYYLWYIQYFFEQLFKRTHHRQASIYLNTKQFTKIQSLLQSQELGLSQIIQQMMNFLLLLIPCYIKENKDNNIIEQYSTYQKVYLLIKYQQVFQKRQISSRKIVQYKNQQQIYQIIIQLSNLFKYNITSTNNYKTQSINNLTKINKQTNKQARKQKTKQYIKQTNKRHLCKKKNQSQSIKLLIFNYYRLILQIFLYQICLFSIMAGFQQTTSSFNFYILLLFIYLKQFPFLKIDNKLISQIQTMFFF
ncbi:transmembrane protein, putative (macronuclear) [Tetrahymena thermophila SB210]|uniref:Transmembrane protein, putative n=1 Tax=Tetrahymena thermophila (strain SB210) TaxID=312017 RepID=Q23KF1_TETTS|nr:transmembrane protein, putative [Tetrahymena thermophila SB210]EAR96892.3 transmembrane protein, putative [Tetrahymena thermophila SB210]|eukprot:XP_001017137.3 transmembrane protein, putative [Tetrahymena thermophila SB210]